MQQWLYDTSCRAEHSAALSKLGMITHLMTKEYLSGIRIGYWYTRSLNLEVTVLKLKSARLRPILSCQISCRAGAIGVTSVPGAKKPCKHNHSLQLPFSCPSAALKLPFSCPSAVLQLLTYAHCFSYKLDSSIASDVTCLYKYIDLS